MVQKILFCEGEKEKIVQFLISNSAYFLQFYNKDKQLRRMKKVLKISKLKDKNDNYKYWSKQTDIARLQAIEILRQQYINFEKRGESRLQKVLVIFNKAQS